MFQHYCSTILVRNGTKGLILKNCLIVSKIVPNRVKTSFNLSLSPYATVAVKRSTKSNIKPPSSDIELSDNLHTDNKENNNINNGTMVPNGKTPKKLKKKKSKKLKTKSTPASAPILTTTEPTDTPIPTSTQNLTDTEPIDASITTPTPILTAIEPIDTLITSTPPILVKEAVKVEQPVKKDPYAIFEKEINWVSNNEKVLISIDLEAYEKRLSAITEVGISIYNPRNQKGSIIPEIKNFHFLIQEHLKFHNSTYVPDNSKNFISGPSIVIGKKQLNITFNQIINHYKSLEKNDNIGIAFVGHGFSADIKFLKSLSISLPIDIPIIDTSNLWKIDNPIGKGSLGYILKSYDIPYSFLHNAGNDSYYTLLLALKMFNKNTRILRKIDEIYSKEDMNNKNPFFELLNNHFKIIQELKKIKKRTPSNFNRIHPIHYKDLKEGDMKILIE